jgi:hypothetical protein
MNQHEKDSLDRHITGNYGENHFRNEAEFETELDRLLNLRETALVKSPTLLKQTEKKLDALAPNWREYIE